MSDDTISISELYALRKGWPEQLTPVLSDSGKWDGKFDHSDNEHTGEGYIECSSDGMDSAELFAKLIAAEHNAIPVLAGAVKAALEHERTRVVFETSAKNDDRPVFECHRARMQQAHRDFLDALAKVRT